MEPSLEDEDDPFLQLFDYRWFRRLILLPEPSPPPPTLHRRRRHRRTHSEEVAPLSPVQIPPAPKLQTILSSKEAEEFPPTELLPAAAPAGDGRRRQRRKKGSKSLSDLEFEELKGLMDLGFTFSDAENDPRLMEIVPGLQRRWERKASGEEGDSTSPPAPSEAGVEKSEGVMRPYLSEAWEAAAEEERIRLRRWRIPAAEEGVDIKDYLKLWAQTVASTVR